MVGLPGGLDGSPEAGPSTYASRPASASPRRASPGPRRPTPKLFPGFLSEGGAGDEYDHTRAAASPTLVSPIAGSPRQSQTASPLQDSPGLAYLRQSPGTRSPIGTPTQNNRSRAGGGDASLNGGEDEVVDSPRGGVVSSPAYSPSGREPLGGAKGMKRRPRPLDLRADDGNVRVDPELQEHLDDIATSITIVTNDSTLSDELQDLTMLRDTVHRNLRDRPVYSPHSGFATPSTPDSAPPDIDETDMIDAGDLLELLHSPAPLLIVDTRATGPFLDTHLPRSVNLSIPSLILKRLRKRVGAAATWEGMGAFVAEGRDVWDGIDPEAEVRVVIMGSWGWDETARAVLPVFRGILPKGRVGLIRGGWQGVEAETNLAEKMEGTKVAGPSTSSVPLPSVPPTRPPAPHRSSTLPVHQTHPPQTAPPPVVPPEPSFLLAPPTPPIEAVPRLAHQLSMPSLRAKRGQPKLSLQTPANGKKPPGLSLNIDRPLKSATVGSFRSSGLRSPGLLKIDTDLSRDPALSPRTLSTALRAQPPPTPGSFGDMDSTSVPPPANSASVLYSEPESVPRTPVVTARHAMSPFIISTILPGFLFLGPEITNDEDVAALRQRGVKRILNVAMECEDESGLGLRETFERYLKIPMRDTVEESGVGKGMRDSCDYLDDARLHDAPTYVHCKAGKSRSVTVVLAYLIHANAWTLKTAYAYVAERRKGISPNIGFVAELMQFEESELGVKQSGGVHGDSGPESGSKEDRSKAGDKGSVGMGKTKSHPRYARETLPPAWGSLGSGKPAWISFTPGDAEGTDSAPVAEPDARKVDEREVRKNGQWVHQRRVPVDRSTLQPGRRASKAGLESLRTLASITSAQPSPRASPTAEGSSATPGAEGRLGWI